MQAKRFPIEAAHVMMFARALGDENPAYYGALTGEPVVAPPTFPWAASQFYPDSPGRPKPGVPWIGSGRTATGQPERSGAGGGLGLHAEQHFEFHRPLRAGDVLSVAEQPPRTWAKEGRKGGRLDFREVVSEYRDENGELVVTARMVSVQTERVPGSDS
jgi:hypothetical protein